MGFANAISGQVAGFVGGAEGLCSYRENTMLQKKDERLFYSPKEGEDPQRWYEDQQRYLAKHSIDAFFVKHIRFSHEAEYRFIWFASGIHKEYLDIKCPEALRYCERY